MELNRQQKIAGAMLGLLAALIWGAWPVVSVLANQSQIAAYDITALRFAVSGCILLPVLWFKRVSLKLTLTKGVILAIGAGAPYVLLATTGLSYAPSAHFGIIGPSSMLVFTAVGSYLWLGERMSAGRMIGLALIISGIVVVGVNSLADMSADTLLGDMMFVGCALLWASFTLLCKHWQLEPWVATALVSVVSMVAYMPFYFTFYLISGDSQILQVPLDTLLFQGVFQGAIVAVVALYFYSKAIAMLGSAKGSIFAAMVPPFAMVLGALFLSERITVIEYAGLALVCGGMVFALEVVRFNAFKTPVRVSETHHVID